MSSVRSDRLDREYLLVGAGMTGPRDTHRLLVESPKDMPIPIPTILQKRREKPLSKLFICELEEVLS